MSQGKKAWVYFGIAFVNVKFSQRILVKHAYVFVYKRATAGKIVHIPFNCWPVNTFTRY